MSRIVRLDSRCGLAAAAAAAAVVVAIEAGCQVAKSVGATLQPPQPTNRRCCFVCVLVFQYQQQQQRQHTAAWQRTHSLVVVVKWTTSGRVLRRRTSHAYTLCKANTRSGVVVVAAAVAAVVCQAAICLTRSFGLHTAKQMLAVQPSDAAQRLTERGDTARARATCKASERQTSS